jgi:hypothetical protein
MKKQEVLTPLGRLVQGYSRYWVRSLSTLTPTYTHVPLQFEQSLGSKHPVHLYRLLPPY